MFPSVDTGVKDAAPSLGIVVGLLLLLPGSAALQTISNASTNFDIQSIISVSASLTGQYKTDDYVKMCPCLMDSCKDTVLQHNQPVSK